jgi:hypothetical protein
MEGLAVTTRPLQFGNLAIFTTPAPEHLKAVKKAGVHARGVGRRSGETVPGIVKAQGLVIYEGGMPVGLPGGDASRRACQ